MVLAKLVKLRLFRKIYELGDKYRYVTFFCAGAGLELFMNFFHIGEANIYRSIERAISTSNAEQQFNSEKQLYESLVMDTDSTPGKRN